MTNAQQEVRTEQDLKDLRYERRAFRKECVTQKIVSFVRPSGYYFYSVEYRGRYVTTLYRDSEDECKLRAMWNTIAIAEQLLKAEQFVRELKESKHESN